MTDDEIEAMAQSWPVVDAGEWAEAVLKRIRLHRSHDVSGLLSMLEYDLADFLDVLAVVPLLIEREAENEYERRRLRHLENLKIDWARIRREETAHENYVHGGRSGGRKRASQIHHDRRARRSDVHTRRDDGEVKI